MDSLREGVETHEEEERVDGDLEEGPRGGAPEERERAVDEAMDDKQQREQKKSRF